MNIFVFLSLLLGAFALKSYNRGVCLVQGCVLDSEPAHPCWALRGFDNVGLITMGSVTRP